MATHTAPALSELVLSSTHAASPLPTISLHNPLTGALVYSFRSPVASTSTGPNGAARNGVTDKDQPSLEHRTTFAAVEGSHGCGGYLVGLGGKEGRAGMHVWNFTRETTQHRLIPPVRLTTMTVSRDGAYMAGGTPDGRIFLWEVSSGTLIVTIDAHYRSVSTLAFSDDGACLVSGSEDAGVSVWAMGRLLNASPMNPPAPFATLADHTLPVTDVCVGLGTFPQCRIMTASLDSTVKIWDISTTPASLLSTFSFPHPVSHIAWDALERHFFAAGPTLPSSANAAASTSTAEASSSSSSVGGSRVVRVNLFRRRKDEFGFDVTEPVGGGGRGEVERVGGEGQSQSQGQEGETYEISETITSLHLSSHSPTLLVGLANSAIHLLSLPSLLPTRVLTPPPSSTSPGPITFLTTLLRPPELGSSNADLPQRVVMPQGMGRTVVGPDDRERGGPKGRIVEMRIGAAGSATAAAFGLSGVGSVEDLISPVQGVPSLLAQLSAAGNGAFGGAAAAAGGAGAGAGAAALDKERKRAHDLERQVEALQRDLGRAASVNEAMWKKVVDSALKG
ncbi:hypothetical protein BMF94_4070 [Rhodotorula taiwanensis]|uniref:Pre-rRNA-processing protein IPI3 n=1 Tax=Rhodotorula taiwanensis TaxID=741276 RepID=A0A2S5B821_9BASI|nr:hypothetical protein BMF94_4070 [Rhodotorula taiwanensis]